MKKIVIPILALLLLPTVVFAADELTFDADTNINLSTNDITVVVKSGSIADSMTVNPTNIQFTLSANSSVTVTSAERRILTNDLGISTSCTTISSITLPAQSSQTVVTVTPEVSQTCETTGGGSTPSTPAPSGGGGGGPATPTKPTTTTGEVTATASGGGKTTVTTDDNATAAADLPANAVSASTAIQITPEAKDAVVNSRPIPSGKTVIGGYIYNYTATVNEETVSSFDKAITLSFTYTDEQISGQEEANLRVYYWNESISQWTLLSTTVFAATNTLTVSTDHFTYFAIFGGEVSAAEEEEVIEEEVSAEEVTINEGDIIRSPSAPGLAQFDIYIVKVVGTKKFKRLVLSPHVFESYEHLRWGDVKDVSQSVMSQYTTSDLVRAVGDPKVYKLTPAGDTGTKQWLNMDTSGFVAQGYDWDAIYTINTTDRDAYTTGSEITGPGAVTGTSQPAEEASTAETIIIKISTLRVRSLPSLSGDILTNVRQGEVYQLLDEQEGWYKITANGFTGWCYGGDTGGYAAKQ